MISIIEEWASDIESEPLNTAYSIQQYNPKTEEVDTVIIPLGGHSNGMTHINGKEYTFKYFKPSDPNIILENGCYIDTLTGEILEQVRKPSKRKTIEVMPFKDFKSLEELKEWALSNGYKATQPTHFDLSPLSAKDKAVVSLLIQEIRYIHIHFYTRSLLKAIFECDDKHINRKLNALQGKGYLTYTTKGLMHKGQVKITFNPLLAFKGSKNQRQERIKIYTRPEGFKLLEDDWLEKFLENPDRLKPVSHDYEQQATDWYEKHLLTQDDHSTSNSNLVKVLMCSDINFSMFVNGTKTIDDL